MRQRNSRTSIQAALILGLVLGVTSACATSGTPAPGDHSGPVQMVRANYIVSLSRSEDMNASSESPAQMRAKLDADRDRILTAVFGAERPAPGASFVSAHAFEIRLTPEEAQRLMRHPEVEQVEADQISRPTSTRSED